MASKTVILLPTYNERENIKLLIPEIFALQSDVHILVLDDNSPDGTAKEVRSLMGSYPSLGILERPGKEGLGVAYRAGIEHVLKDPEVVFVITMDADGSHAPEYLGAMREAGEHKGLVIGSRYTKGGGIERWEPWRQFLSRWGNFYARTVTRLPIKDMTAGFMHIHAAALRTLDLSQLRASGYAFLMELKFLLHKTGAGVGEVPIIFRSRREGESKISHHIIREGLKTPWTIARRR